VSQLSVELIDPRRSRELRRSVLRPETAPGDPLPGDDLADAVHIGVLVDRRLVSTCFVYPDTCPWLPEVEPAWHLRQMATWPDDRGHGYAGAVVDYAIEYVRTRNARLLWLHGRELAVPLYRRNGFVDEGELFTDEEHAVPHLCMYQFLHLIPEPR
jgi:GNAT superfamily N-acetyltransferase